MSELITVGQIIDKSWDHYKQYFQPLMKVSLWILAGTLLMIIGSILAPIGKPGELIAAGGLSGVEFFGTLLVIISSSIITPLLLIWVVLGLIIMVENQAINKKVTAQAAERAATKKFLPFVWVSIMKTVIIALPTLLVVPGVVLLMMSAAREEVSAGGLGGLLMLIGVPLAIGLALMLIIQFAFIGYELTLHNKHGRSALGASRALVKGRWWATLWRYLIPRMVFIFFGAIAAIVALIAMGLIITSISLTSIESAVRISNVFTNLIASGVTILILPIITIADYYLFDSLRKIK